ncbi:MAG: hypothetical protein NTW99_06995 [Chloroflexi bacterium]|nr:hypothetical protein [Chloroflexota bacterium]
MNACLNCKKTEQEIPLLQMRYQQADVFICPQCLPVLIHKPANLAEKLPGLENVQPPQHEH